MLHFHSDVNELHTRWNIELSQIPDVKYKENQVGHKFCCFTQQLLGKHFHFKHASNLYFQELGNE